jgi:drug/metabolite transporter (DMT)-like permease
MFAAYLALIALTCIWGLTFPVVQDSLEFASPLVFVALRFLLAAVIFPLLVWPRAHQLNRDLIRKGVWLGILLWGGYALQTVGLAYTTSARAAFITGTFVPLTPVFAWALFRAHISLRMWIAVLLAFAGVAIMAQPEVGGFRLGDFFALLCAVCFALQVVFISRWAHPDNECQLTWLQLGTTSLLAALFIPFESAVRLEWSGYLIFGLVFTAIFASAFAIWGQLRFQPKIPVSAAAVIYSLEPLTAGLAAWWLQDHIPPPVTLLGAGFIVAGMIISSTVKQRELESV